jgi:uncharacterized membrane protein YGL010W
MSSRFLNYASLKAPHARSRGAVTWLVVGILVIPVSVMMAGVVTLLGGGDTAVAGAYLLCSVASVLYCSLALVWIRRSGHRGIWMSIFGILCSLLIPGILFFPYKPAHQRPASTTTLSSPGPPTASRGP